jgi:hypothetical protein
MEVEARMTNPTEETLALSERAVRLSEEVRLQSEALMKTDEPMSRELVRLNKELLAKCEALLEEMSRVRDKLKGR